MAKISAGSYPLGASQRDLDSILNGDYRDVFHAQDYFSVNSSTGHLFEVNSGNGSMSSDVRGDELVDIIKVS